MAVIIPPPHEPVSPFGVEITRPAGNGSLKPTPVRVSVELLFCRVKLRLVEPFSGMLAAPNALVMAGAVESTTVTTALACEVAPFVSVTVSSTVVVPCG